MTPIEILQKRIKHLDEYVLSEDDMSIFAKTKIHFFTSTLIKAVVEFADANCKGFTIQDNVIEIYKK